MTVTDKRGNYIKGLEPANVILFDEKVEQNITSFSGVDTPLSIGMLLDRSGSMRLGIDQKSPLREALKRFGAGSNNANAYFLIGFNRQPQLLLEWTRDVNVLLVKLDDLPMPIHNTALYDACYVGLEKVARGPHRRHALILISDGRDNLSRFTFSEVKRFLQESDTIIYGIIPPETNSDFPLGIPGNPYEVSGPDILSELTNISGGMLYRPRDTNEMHEVFERIAIELRNQYLIAFKPHISGDKKKYRRIKVTLKNDTIRPEFKDLRIRTRQGYYTPGK